MIKLNNYIVNKYINFFIIKYFYFFKKKNKKKIKKIFFIYLIFINNILKYNNNNIFFNNKLYLIKIYNIINNNWIRHISLNIPDLFLTKYNTYFFWHFFNQDKLILLLINLIMKDGKKSISYKNIFKSFFFLKKIVGLNPLLFFKKSLYRNRILFDIKYLTLRKKVITMPQLLSNRRQIVKSIKYIFNNFSIDSWKIKKKTTPFYKKITYLLLNNFFNKNRLINLIKKDTMLLKNNFINIKKENYFNKYVIQINNILKRPLFKVKNVSINKKMKIMKSRLNLIKRINKYFDFNKIFLLNRYKTNLQSRKKLKSKWF